MIELKENWFVILRQSFKIGHPCQDFLLLSKRNIFSEAKMVNFIPKINTPRLKESTSMSRGTSILATFVAYACFFDRESFRRFLKRLHDRNLHLAGDNGVGKTWLAKTIGAAQPDGTEKNVPLDKLPNYCGWNRLTIFFLFC